MNLFEAAFNLDDGRKEFNEDYEIDNPEVRWRAEDDDTRFHDWSEDDVEDIDVDFQFPEDDDEDWDRIIGWEDMGGFEDAWNYEHGKNESLDEEYLPGPDMELDEDYSSLSTLDKYKKLISIINENIEMTDELSDLIMSIYTDIASFDSYNNTVNESKFRPQESHKLTPQQQKTIDSVTKNWCKISPEDGSDADEAAMKLYDKKYKSQIDKHNMEVFGFLW